MQTTTRFDGPGELPALLAEYGQLAAQLPGCDHAQAERIHQRLRELDKLIEHRLAAELRSAGPESE